MQMQGTEVVVGARQPRCALYDLLQGLQRRVASAASQLRLGQRQVRFDVLGSAIGEAPLEGPSA